MEANSISGPARLRLGCDWLAAARGDLIILVMAS
jgi:hypothetical protein